jgi:threonyl-tRNA synthetase
MSDEPKRELSRAERLYRLRHSAAHIMAQAVLEIFPEGKVAIGPPVQDGFYYDFDLPRPLTDEDLADVEARMKRIVDGNFPFRRESWPKDEARKYFDEHGQAYKVEIIDRIADPEVSIYHNDQFTDLCAGPHVRYTKECKHFKLLSVAGAYWRGDEKGPMLQRIYGTVWPSKAELEQYLQVREEAKRRDHRKLGRELDLFWFHPWAPGSTLWKPKGTVLYQLLEEHWRRGHRREGYVEIRNPMLYNKELFEQSGHWDHYQENMFILESHGTTMALKPMNCPDTMLFFKSERRSYRELPMRVSEGGLLHRNEKPGALSGLTRVRQFMQDDAHVFVRREQIEEEIGRIIRLIDGTYRLFDFDLRLYLATRPEEFMGEVPVWDAAEKALDAALCASGKPFQLNAGDGAFYGPKIDFYVRDSLGRDWQTATVQLDFQLPERFDLTFISPENKPERPVVIHRAVYGSFERFIAILIEHLGGAFPTWLAPVQARVMALTDEVNEYAHQVAAELREHDLRIEVDDRSEKIGYKIREAEMAKVPYMLVVGARDREAGVVDVRTYGGGRRGTMRPAELAEEMVHKTREKLLDVSLQKIQLWSDEDVLESEMEEVGY